VVREEFLGKRFRLLQVLFGLRCEALLETITESFRSLTR
jgi:hypothetical protein